VTATDLSREQIDTKKWLLKAIGRKARQKKLAEWDEEETRKLYELKADIEKVELRMR
jgi:hypothetical protein